MTTSYSHHSLKFVAVGDGAVGKTSALMSFSQNAVPGSYEPTIFDNYSVSLMVDGRPAIVQLWDTAGQDDYDRLRPLSYPQTDVFLLFYSILSPHSFKNAKAKWAEELSRLAPGSQIALIGTKLDLAENEMLRAQLGMQGAQPITEAEGDAMAKEIGAFGHFRCSAMTQEGLKQVFDAAIRHAIKKNEGENEATTACGSCVIC